MVGGSSPSPRIGDINVARTAGGVCLRGRAANERAVAAGVDQSVQPDLFLHVAKKMMVRPGECIVVEDSVVGVQAGVAAGMTVIGFTGGSHTGGQIVNQLLSAGARTVISDMRALKGTVIDLRGW